ncbi:hypothetical protein IU486_31365 [Streptomyces gardneri]|uniref:MFS transporter n=1 Tax=Nocardia abscessus TaxID=120957 RepID=UPI0018948FC8|nr:MFS transporter [Nocardia abscessus]MBF6169203.1 hypothetical protein [Streptomyces gardneri]MBF6475288.1 hypothetical protein [Nocardia abscessus]
MMGQLLRRGTVIEMLALVAVRRFTDSAFPVVLIVALSELRSIPVAAAIVGVRVTVASVSAPLRARLLDRLGRPRVVPALTVASIGTLIAFVLVAIAAQIPLAVVLIVGAVNALTAPSVDAVIRATWRDIADSEDEVKGLHAADSIVEEASFIVGPLLASTVILAIGAEPSLAVFLTLTVLGSVLVYAPRALRNALRQGPAATKDTTALDRRHSVGSRMRTILGPIVERELFSIIFPIVVMGTALGLFGVIIPAVSDGLGKVGFAGFFFALISVGGLAGGLWYGSRTLRSDLSVRHAILTCAISVPLLIGPLVGNPWVLGAVLVVAGLSVTPIYINSYLLIDRDITPSAAHEANSWVSVGNNMGYAGGLFAGGLILDGLGKWWLATSLTAVGFVGVTTSLLLWRTGPTKNPVEQVVSAEV